jgi:cell division protein ZapA (FtsZ GTPase activity inhibitor)
MLDRHVSCVVAAREADVVADEGERGKLLKVADDLVGKVKDIKEQNFNKEPSREGES